MTELELHWLAGLFEGEGCFTKGTAASYSQVIVQINMTDEDVIRDVYQAIGYGRVYKRKAQKEGYKPQWQWKVTGEKAVELMSLLLPLMRSRRQERIRELLVIHKIDRERGKIASMNNIKYMAKRASEVHSGKPKSTEHRKALSEAQKKRWAKSSEARSRKFDKQGEIW